MENTGFFFDNPQFTYWLKLKDGHTVRALDLIFRPLTFPFAVAWNRNLSSESVSTRHFIYA